MFLKIYVNKILNLTRTMIISANTINHISAIKTPSRKSLFVAISKVFTPRGV